MPAQSPAGSGSSTPYLPQTEEERTEREHQQEVDLQLATSMSRGLDPIAMARSRSRSGGQELQRNEMGETYRALRDAQAEQDAHFFDASASPNTRQNMLSSRPQRSPPGSSNAAARFYRQNRRRTLSDTSVDSQAGFIDHRGSQASMPIRASGRSDRHLSPRDIVKSAARSKTSRLRAEVQAEGGRANRGDDTVDAGSGSDRSDREDESMQQDSTSPTRGSRARKGTYESGLSASKPEALRSRSSYDMPDREFDRQALEGSAVTGETIDDDEPGVVDHRGHGSQSRRSPVPREFLHRTNTRGSQRSGHSHHSERHDKRSDEEDPTFTPSLSRRPSDVGKVEEDVCYPMLQMRDAEMEEEHREEERRRRHDSQSRMSYHGRETLGIPGVLPNFPFPFDFDALEEHCEEEREKHGIAIPRAKADNAGSGTAVASGSSGTKAISFSPDNPSGGMMRRRMNGEVPSRRQRKLSESVSGHVGRYQRKLALFEGSAGQRGDAKTTSADVKTPLLAEGGKTRPTFGATAFASHRSNGSGPEKARPYRFSFYSNALPSTIHARSMAEIPAEGQTFEELFVGRRDKTPADDWEEQANGDATRHSDGQRHGSTGHSTPQHGQPAPAPSVASYKTVGAMGGMMSKIPTTEHQKPRTNMIRSVEDAEANTWWLDVLCPTDAEMKVLGKVFGIHPLTIEDILMEETREKIELFRNYYFVCFRSFDQDPYSPTYLEPLNMYIIVFREGTLSFHFRGTPHPQNVRRRIKQLKDFINVTSDWISYALIDDITDAFGPLIQNIEYEVDSIDELVLILKDAEQSDMLRRIGTCRKKVMGLLRLMGNKADVVKGLAKRCNENWSVAPKSDIGLYLSDIQDHLITMTQNLNHYEKILSRSHSNYLAQISIEMTDANNQINDVLSKLTALGTVLIPMNLVTGLWGMNVRVPGEGVENFHWFFSIVAFLLAFALAGGYLTYRAFSK